MSLKQLGERRIIEIFEKNFKRSYTKNVVIGIGDDACVVQIDNSYLVASTDMIYQKTHIPREMTPRQLGKYAVNVNLSDLAAMGASPIGLLFSFGLPKDLDEKFVDALSKGISEACREHNTRILGGDTKEHSEIVIAGTALGKIGGGKFLARSAAKVGDFICVTGAIGSAAAGFYCLTKNLPIEKNISGKFILAALEPKARVREAQILAKYANACIDVSDGLAFSLYEIAKASRRGFLIYEDKVSVDKDIKKVSELAGVPLREIVFHKGGDYELLFTVSPKKIEALEKELQQTGTKMSVIGRVTNRGMKIATPKGVEPLEPRGYESFTSQH